MKRRSQSIGDGVEDIARDIAWQIVDQSGYEFRPEFSDFAPLARELLARTPAVLQTAALAYSQGLDSVDLGDDVANDRLFKVATLDAFDAIATTFAARLAADELSDLPPEQRRDWRDWHC